MDICCCPEYESRQYHHYTSLTHGQMIVSRILSWPTACLKAQQEFKCKTDEDPDSDKDPNFNNVALGDGQR